MYWYGMNNTVPKSFSRDAEITPYTLALTDRDYAAGSVTRYFVRQANHRSGEIVEITATAYQRLQGNHLWTTVALPWRISGRVDDVMGTGKTAGIREYTGARTANRLSLETADQILPGMRYHITNLLQYYKSS